ncbi:DUF177 domain-containing protein [Methylosinus sp. H3A]|uniref:YceD family protein n=1 Tax=Methylosinus sp. H3A TaxID=2785786 RepID=UPI0018C2F8C3|nr:YceD family protein [Methylosinus sp. H3A]MBG0810960.1 DUF177 domain-containing protein [Methylosinus sp. H3A]
MSDDLQLPKTPFSRPLAAVDVPEDGLERSIAAEAKERAALAEADGLPALNRLEAKLLVTREGRDGLRVTGELSADVRQTCVVTLEDFDTRVVEPIDVSFAPEASPAAPPHERRQELRQERMSRRRREAAPEEPKDPKEARASRHIADLDDDAPDPLVDGRIDLGAIVAEFFALALDPYPRKPGARFAPPGEAAAEEEERPPAKASPFARLRDALDKDGGN